MIDERPATPPDLKKLDRIRQWHDIAMQLFDEMYEDARQNLIKRNYPVRNAAVNRKDWRHFMSWKYNFSWEIAQEIEHSLIDAGVIQCFGGYAVRTKRNEK